jgi:hypothetical protein
MAITTSITVVAMPMIMPVNANSNYSKWHPITRVVSIIIRWSIRYVCR